MYVLFPNNSLLMASAPQTWDLHIHYKPDHVGELVETRRGLHPHTKAPMEFALVKYNWTLSISIVATINGEFYHSSCLDIIKVPFTQITPRYKLRPGNENQVYFEHEGRGIAFMATNREERLKAADIIAPYVPPNTSNDWTNSVMSKFSQALYTILNEKILLHIDKWLKDLILDENRICRCFFGTSTAPDEIVSWEDAPADWGLLETKENNQ